MQFILIIIYSINIYGQEEQCNRNQTLILLHEQNIRDSLYYENERNESNIPDAFETSGVVLRPDTLIMYIIFDNTFQIGVFCTWLAIRTINCTNKLLDWPDNTFNKLNSEFEGIAYNSLTDTYFIVQETISSNVSSNEYNSNIFEVQITTNVTFSSINLIQSCRINWTFESTSKGFEGLEFMMHHKRNKNYLLALCEGNKCKPQSNSEDPVTSLGNGKLVVLDKHETTHNNSCQWVSVGIINLPFDIKFRDYSAISAYKQNTSTYIAVTSQVNSQVWIGIIEEIDQNPYFRITSSNKTGVYNLPRTIVNGSMCAKEYCNIEGVAWINENQLILVSDLAKKSHGVLCFRKDENTCVCYDISKSKCTYPNERIYWSYKQVKCLHYIKYKTNRINYSNLLLIQFSNSQHLKITISFDDNFWSFVFSVHRLTTLEGILDENYSHYQLITYHQMYLCILHQRRTL
ncbi:unnamed protein product [Rotaria sp. Silwood1]|nr:unnamed protein product [Rotaria sp. Silwood1]